MNQEMLSKIENLIDNGDLEVDIDHSTPPIIDKDRVINLNHRTDSLVSADTDDINTFFTENLNDIIYEVDDVIQKYDGVHQGWQIGRLGKKYVDNGEFTQGQFSTITDLGYKKDGTYVRQMINIYDIFNDHGYAENHFNKSSLGEITQIKNISDQMVVEINNNARKFDIYVDQKRMRSLRSIKSNNNISEVVEDITSRNNFSNMLPKEISDIIYDGYRLLDQNVDYENILTEVKDGI